jgi:tetratricopeptide (TPR) repeat protein
MEIKDLFTPGNHYTFLAGAGVSYDSPSNLPIAEDIVYGVLNVLNIDEKSRIDLKHKFNSHDLRFEQFIEQLSFSYGDTDLQMLNLLNECDSPNRLHFFLANAILHDHSVFTTNFDSLIEKAARRNSIRSIFDRESALVYSEKIGRILWKLHGTLRDQEGIDQRQSILTSISRIGQLGEFFSLAKEFQKILDEKVSKNDLVVLGYSGSDDFDIVPALSQIQSQKKMFWIWHDKNLSSPFIYSYCDFIKKEKQAEIIFGKIISFGYWDTEKIFILSGKTDIIISQIQEIIMPDITFPKFDSPFEPPLHFYDNWKYEFALEYWRNLFFLGNIYKSLGYYKKAKEYLAKALIQADTLQEIDVQAYIHMTLSKIYQRLDQREMADQHIEEYQSFISKLKSEFKAEEDPIQTADYYLHRANLLADSNNLDEAEEMLSKVETQKDTNTYGVYLCTKANILLKKGYIWDAHTLVEKAFHVFQQNGDLENTTACLDFLARNYSDDQNFRKALDSILKAIRICKFTQNSSQLAGCYLQRGDIFRRMGILGRSYYDLITAHDIYEKLDARKDQAIASAKIGITLRKIENVVEKMNTERGKTVYGTYNELLGTIMYSTFAPLGRLSSEIAIDIGDHFVFQGKKKAELPPFKIKGLLNILTEEQFDESPLVIHDKLPSDTKPFCHYFDKALEIAQSLSDDRLKNRLLKIVCTTD